MLLDLGVSAAGAAGVGIVDCADGALLSEAVDLVGLRGAVSEWCHACEAMCCWWCCRWCCAGGADMPSADRALKRPPPSAVPNDVRRGADSALPWCSCVCDHASHDVDETVDVVGTAPPLCECQKRGGRKADAGALPRRALGGSGAMGSGELRPDDVDDDALGDDMMLLSVGVCVCCEVETIVSGWVMDVGEERQTKRHSARQLNEIRSGVQVQPPTHLTHLFLSLPHPRRMLASKWIALERYWRL